MKKKKLGLWSEEVESWVDEMNTMTKRRAKSRTDLGIRPSQDGETFCLPGLSRNQYFDTGDGLKINIHKRVLYHKLQF